MQLPKIIKYIKDDILVYCYFMSLLLVLYGLCHYYGGKYIAPISLYIGAFVCFYFLFKRIFRDNSIVNIVTNRLSIPEYLLRKSLPFGVIACLIFIVIHLVYLGHVPIIS